MLGLCIRAKGLLLAGLSAPKPGSLCEVLSPCLGPGILHPGRHGWLTGGFGGQRKKGWCPSLGAQVCTHLWSGEPFGPLQRRSQGPHHGSPNIPTLPSGGQGPPVAGNFEGLPGHALSCAWSSWPGSVGGAHPDGRIDTCPSQGDAVRAGVRGVPRGTPLPITLLLPASQGTWAGFCLALLQIQSVDYRGPRQPLGRGAGVDGRGSAWSPSLRPHAAGLFYRCAQVCLLPKPFPL